MAKIGKYFTLEEFCTCTNTYHKHDNLIDPYPQNLDSIAAIKDLCLFIIDPIIDYFGKKKFQLTYGFCSPKLKYFLDKKDPLTGIKNGRISPDCDQHMAWELNSKGKYYCKKLGAACDFQIQEINSSSVIKWIVDRELPFDSLYYYGDDRPIHISYGSEHKRAIWGFLPTGQPTKKGLLFLNNNNLVDFG
jgi:hypothetical protein